MSKFLKITLAGLKAAVWPQCLTVGFIRSQLSLPRAMKRQRRSPGSFTPFRLSALAACILLIAIGIASSQSAPTIFPTQPALPGPPLIPGWQFVYQEFAPSSNPTTMTLQYSVIPAAPPSTKNSPPPASLPSTQPGWVYSPTTPPLPTTFPAGWAVHVAGAVPKGAGIYSVGHAANQTITNSFVWGFDQNIVAETYAGSLTMSGIVSACALHDPGNLFDGQGMYLTAINGGIIATNCCFAWNGWQTGQDPALRQFYYHGGYHNAPNGPLAISNSLLASNAACGIETRAGATISNCCLIDSAIGVLAVMGQTTISDSVIFGGHLIWTGSAWAEDVAVYAYWPVVLRNVVIVATPGQGAAPATPTGAEVYPAGCIVSGGTWSNAGNPPWTPPPAKTALITATGCTIVGNWPSPTDPATGRSLVFAGISPAAPPGQLAPGFIAAPPITYDPTPIVNAVIAGQMTPAAGQAAIQSAVRGLVGQ